MVSGALMQAPHIIESVKRAVRQKNGTSGNAFAF
jgi:hypothetical protein